MAAVNGMPFTIETLMSVAAIGAVFIDASEEAAAVVFLFLVGELLEGVAAGRARASIKGARLARAENGAARTRWQDHGSSCRKPRHRFHHSRPSGRQDPRGRADFSPARHLSTNRR
jgi:cation transport ATPase